MKQGEPFTDRRDNRTYNTFVTSWGLRWFADNLAHPIASAQPPAVIEDASDFPGLAYPYEAALEAVPHGWRLPTAGEWLRLYKEYDADLFHLPDTRSTGFGREYSFWTSTPTRQGWLRRPVARSMKHAKIISDQERYMFSDWIDTPMLVRCVAC